MAKTKKMLVRGDKGFRASLRSYNYAGIARIASFAVAVIVIKMNDAAILYRLPPAAGPQPEREFVVEYRGQGYYFYTWEELKNYCISRGFFPAAKSPALGKALAVELDKLDKCMNGKGGRDDG